MSTLLCATILALVVASNGFPSQGNRYYPRTVMMGGYYGMNPMGYPHFISQESDNVPEASEEEFKEESVTENSFVEHDEEQGLTQSSGILPKSKEPLLPKKTVPKTPKKQPLPDADHSLDSNFPFGSGGSSLFNTFFPIMLGGTSGMRGKSGEDSGSPGGATAIANSFSTGRGGIASSHATSFGDVFLSSASRNRNNRIREAM